MDLLSTLDRHPDKHGSASKEVQDEAELEFKKVAWAYEILSSNRYSSTTSEGGGDYNPFNFNSYYEEWKSTSWSNFWERDEGING